MGCRQALLTARVTGIGSTGQAHLLHRTCILAEPHSGRADVVAGQCLFISKWLGFITAEKHPKTLAYLERIMQRPAFGRVFLPSKEA